MSHKRKFVAIVISVALLLFAVGILLSGMWSGGEVTVKPKFTSDEYEVMRVKLKKSLEIEHVLGISLFSKMNDIRNRSIGFAIFPEEITVMLGWNSDIRRFLFARSPKIRPGVFTLSCFFGPYADGCRTIGLSRAYSQVIIQCDDKTVRLLNSEFARFYTILYPDGSSRRISSDEELLTTNPKGISEELMVSWFTFYSFFSMAWQSNKVEDVKLNAQRLLSMLDKSGSLAPLCVLPNVGELRDYFRKFSEGNSRLEIIMQESSTKLIFRESLIKKKEFVLFPFGAPVEG